MSQREVNVHNCMPSTVGVFHLLKKKQTPTIFEWHCFNFFFPRTKYTSILLLSTLSISLFSHSLSHSISFFLLLFVLPLRLWRKGTTNLTPVTEYLLRLIFPYIFRNVENNYIPVTIYISLRPINYFEPNRNSQRCINK